MRDMQKQLEEQRLRMENLQAKLDDRTSSSLPETSGAADPVSDYELPTRRERKRPVEGPSSSANPPKVSKTAAKQPKSRTPPSAAKGKGKKG